MYINLYIYIREKQSNSDRAKRERSNSLGNSEMRYFSNSLTITELSKSETTVEVQV